MRLRFALPWSLLTVLAAVALPGTASAAPAHDRGATINATPNPIIAGEGVFIYGQLTGNDVAGKPITLYHRVNPTRRYTVIGHTVTNSFGFYQFTREEGVVYTDRSWFVRGPDGAHSRTVYERVSALVSLHANRTTADTNQPVVFFGHVTPSHAFERVFLQVQRGAADDWRTIASDRLDRGSDYAIVRRWRTAGQRTVRVVFRGDRRNIWTASDPVGVTVEQHQVPSFTINTSQPVIGFGGASTLSGILRTAGGTTPDPGVPVTLCGRPVAQARFTCDTAGVTGNNGSYSFTVSPVHNEVYFVQTTLPPHRHTARVFEGVRDVVSMSAGPSMATASQPVTFTGMVTPNKAGDTAYLQRLGPDGDWHTVGAIRVKPDSTFQFVRVFGTAGAKKFRARVLSDPQNVGGASSMITVTVTPAAASTLPPAH